MSAALRLLVLCRAVSAAKLQLTGDYNSNVIEFSSPTSNAHISASCDTDGATVLGIFAPGADSFPTIQGEAEYLQAGSLSVLLGNVVPCSSVADVKKTPCATLTPHVKSLFWCKYAGEGGTSLTGPVSAEMEVVTVGSVTAGISTTATCPLPSLAEISALGQYVNDGAPFSVNVSIVYFATRGPDSLLLPFRGAQGDDVLQLTAFSTPPLAPPSHPPSGPSPPSTPPHAPPVEPAPPAEPPAGCTDASGGNVGSPYGILVQDYCWYYSNGAITSTCDLACSGVPGGSNQGTPSPHPPHAIRHQPWHMRADATCLPP